jgi:hypothetical protein
MEVAMKKRSRLITVMIAVCSFGPGEVSKLANCYRAALADRAPVVDALHAHWGEFLAASGLSATGGP